ncbi:MAG: CDP-diacylglycerol--glycerol-3-phosphate 3-phosphatidyltransferase [Clostridia bacterium]|nr:CDP-diacylglycerol--glycerol-3-phosphate 3-phosphatidyltransferase [Clostridia bacterium]
MKTLFKDFWTIPNMITLFRIIAVPFIIWCTVDPNTYLPLGGQVYPLIGLIILVVAAVSDLFDGWIARRFNQGSQLGEMADPFADKIMQCSAVLSLVIIGYVHWAFIVVLVLKELLMIIGGFFMAGDAKNIKANFMGKIASLVICIAIVFSYFHSYWLDKAYLDWIILGLGVVLTYIAFFNYLKQAIVIIKGIFAKRKAIKEGTYVEPTEEAEQVAVEVIEPETK